MKTSIKAALITGILGIIGTISAAIIGNSTGEKNAVEQLYSQITTVTGDNNSVIINSVDDFLAQYNKLQSENETLKAQNSQYFSDYTEQKNINDNLESQLNERPAVMYNNLGLCINGEDIPINKQNSIVTIDGKEYYSKELAESFLDDTQNITVKGDTLFVGKVVADKSQLIDQWIIDEWDCDIESSVNDSFGNNYFDSLILWTRSGHITFNLNNNYSYLKIKISSYPENKSSICGSIIIKADEEIVYTSPEINIFTEVIDADIPINKCSTLTITGTGSDFYRCIISDAIVYN